MALLLLLLGLKRIRCGCGVDAWNTNTSCQLPRFAKLCFRFAVRWCGGGPSMQFLTFPIELGTMGPPWSLGNGSTVLPLKIFIKREKAVKLSHIVSLYLPALHGFYLPCNMTGLHTPKTRRLTSVYSVAWAWAIAPICFEVLRDVLQTVACWCSVSKTS